MFTGIVQAVGRIVRLSPLEIEECMKDLIRRGVVTLKKA